MVKLTYIEKKGFTQNNRYDAGVKAIKATGVLEDFYNNQLDKYNIKPIPKEKYDIDNVFEDWKKFLNI